MPTSIVHVATVARLRWGWLVVLALLNACGSSDSDGVGGVSASEARALNEAAATLDARVGVTEDGASGLNPAARMASARPQRRMNSMERALSEYVIEGVKTTIPFHQQLMQNEDFRKGNYTTKFMESFKLR
mgnify:CR=1 FL=1